MISEVKFSRVRTQIVGTIGLLAAAFLLSHPRDAKAQCQWDAGTGKITQTCGNVGIGTTSPSFKLDVLGNSRISGSNAQLQIDGIKVGGNSWLMQTVDADGRYRIYDNTSFAERITILQTGNVGIGTMSPGRLLDLVSTSSGEDGIRVTGSAVSRLDLWSTNPNAGSRNWTFRPDNYVYGDFGLFQSNARLGDPFGGTGTNRLYIKNDGKVGIGTTAPTAMLHVIGTATFSGATSTGTLTVTGDESVSGNVSVTGNIAAKYQDVAEWVPATYNIAPGTVVTLDPEHSNHVLASSRAYDTRVAGVVSEKPGVILGEGGEGKVLVATTGRVRVKVDATDGPIRVGDLLVTSDKEGIAMRSQPLDLGGTPIHRPGTLIGKALEPLEKGVGEILVLLSLQ
ncbi:MAG TPA: hypothetical protein VLM38_22270 [Blastocatellia bacterium]|nr:hypothetical protein [Blastocatellia bacterium]